MEFPAARDRCGFVDRETDWLKKERVDKSLCTAIVCYAKLHMESFQLSCEHKLESLVMVRNRITHPSSVADLEVSDKERIDAWSAAEAIIEDVTRLFNLCNAKVPKLSVD